jgi:hypothetical protein
MTLDQSINRRLARVYRELMTIAAHRWRLACRGPGEEAHAAKMLERAVYYRIQAQIYAGL